MSPKPSHSRDRGAQCVGKTVPVLPELEARLAEQASHLAQCPRERVQELEATRICLENQLTSLKEQLCLVSRPDLLSWSVSLAFRFDSNVIRYTTKASGEQAFCADQGLA
jgi:hypothetical protein